MMSNLKDLLESNISFSNAALIICSDKSPKSIEGVTERMKWLGILADRFGGDWTPDVGTLVWSQKNKESSLVVNHKSDYLNNPPSKERTITPEQLINLLAEHRHNELALRVREAWAEVKTLKHAPESDALELADQYKPVQLWSIKQDHERGGDVLRDWIIDVLKGYDTTIPKPSVAVVFEGLSDKLTRETARGKNYMKYMFDADGLGGVKYVGKEAIERRIRALMVSN